MSKFFRVYINQYDYEEVFASATYVDSNGILYLFNDYDVHPCDGYEQAVLNSVALYAPGSYFKVITVEIKEVENEVSN